MNFFDLLLSSLTFKQFLEIGVILFAAIMLSFFLNSILFPRLRKRAARTQSAFQRMLFKSLKGEMTIWIFAFAAYLIVEIVKDTPLIDLEIFGYIITGIIIVVGLSVLLFVKDFSDEIIRYMARKGRIPNASLINNLIKFLILIMIAIFVLSLLNFDLTSLIAALGLGGLALALALQDTFGNIISGLSLISSKQIQEGDYIQLDTGEGGYVYDISWRNTTIQTLDEDLIIIPNLKISNSTVINTGKPNKGVRLRINIGISYESDLDLVEKITIQVAKEVIAAHPKGVTEFDPILLFSTFAESSINYDIIMKITDFDGKREIKHDFIKKLTKVYRENGITIPFPIRTMRMENKN